jgi:hypothetical protein
MTPPHDIARIYRDLERCLGKLRLVENSVSELAVPDKGLPPRLATALRQHNTAEARRELFEIGAVLSRILAPIPRELP